MILRSVVFYGVSRSYVCTRFWLILPIPAFRFGKCFSADFFFLVNDLFLRVNQVFSFSPGILLTVYRFSGGCIGLCGEGAFVDSRILW